MDETEETQNEVSDALAEVLVNLPEPVRNFVVSSERDRVSLSLTQKYQLHADQAGEFDRAYIQMLLGVVSPEEFANALRRTGIPETSVAGLTNDINEMVFKPLRQKEREMSERKPEPRPVPPPPPKREVVPLPPPAPPAPEPVQQPVYTPPMQGAQQQTYWVPVSITAVPQPYITTQPPPQYQAPQPPPAPPPPPPAPEPPPPPKREEVVPPPPVWEPAPPPNLPTGDGPSPLTKEYAADPYREPI